MTTEEEPLFDAADVLRFGKDLIVQRGFTTNLKELVGFKDTLEIIEYMQLISEILIPFTLMLHLLR